MVDFLHGLFLCLSRHITPNQFSSIAGISGTALDTQRFGFSRTKILWANKSNCLNLEVHVQHLIASDTQDIRLDNLMISLGRKLWGNVKLVHNIITAPTFPGVPGIQVVTPWVTSAKQSPVPLVRERQIHGEFKNKATPAKIKKDANKKYCHLLAGLCLACVGRTSQKYLPLVGETWPYSFHHP